MRRTPLAALGALTLLSTAPPAPVSAAVPVLVIDGRGFGHGVGMAQDGAYWMGKSGSSTPQILGQFYPGTKLGKAGGPVRVAVHAPADAQVVVAFPNGGELRDALDGRQSPGFPVRVGAGGQVRVRFDGARYSVEGGSASASASSASSSPVGAYRGQSDPTQQQLPTSTTSTTTTSTTTTSTTSTTAPPPRPSPSPSPAAGPSSSRPLWAVPSGTTLLPVRNRRYRGVVELTAQRGPFRAVNQVDVETYLKGMGEVRDPSWPAASLRAQAVAARTYALRAMRANGEICDDQRCQVYLGAQAEYGAMNKAVDDSRGQVLVHGSALASAVYSANGGAHSASRQEGFGVADDGSHPYLRPAPYLTRDPLPWTVRVATADVASRLGYKGELRAVTVGRTGPSGRALEVVLDGSAGLKTVTGIGFARAFSLKSTLFSLRPDTADVAPAPPPAGDGLQVLPEDALPPGFDPNAPPPDPLDAAEIAAAIPDPSQFTAMPERDVPNPTLPARSRNWPWFSLAVFCLVAAGAGAGGLALARRR